MTPAQQADTYVRTWLAGLAGVSLFAAVLAARAEQPSALLAAVGAGAGAALGYSVILWPATQKTISYTVTNMLADQVQQLGGTAAAALRGQ